MDSKKMKSYLSLIPISARVRRRQNRMTLLCIIFAVFLVTAVFSMAEMALRVEQARLTEKHAREFTFQAMMDTTMGKNLFLLAGALFILILLAGVLMISGSINSTVAQRTKFFGMMRCIGMSRQQLKRFVRLEALNWCKTAIPIGIVLGTVSAWALCAVLRFVVGEEFAAIPVFGISLVGIISGIVMGLVTVLLAAGAPARQAAKSIPDGGSFGKHRECKPDTACSPYRQVSHRNFSGRPSCKIGKEKFVPDDGFLCTEHHPVFDILCPAGLCRLSAAPVCQRCRYHDFRGGRRQLCSLGDGGGDS